MEIRSVASAATYEAQQTRESAVKETQSKQTSSVEGTEGVVYEKSTEEVTDSAKQIYSKPDYKAIATQLKEDAAYRQQQMVDLVSRTIGKQASANNLFDLIKELELEDGQGLKSVFENMQVDQETIDQAKADIAEDGYWGVEQTSDRLVDMAIALSGNDTSKADLLIDAVKQGYEEATKAWGDELPEISKQTLDATLEKMNQWKNGVITDVSKDFTS